MPVGASRGLIDPFVTSGTPPRLITQQTIRELGPTSSYEAGLIRLLMGSLELSDIAAGTSFRQKNNYLVLGNSRFRGRSAHAVSKNLHQIGASSSLVDKYLRRSIKQQSYYLDLLLEANEYFWRTKHNQHLAAFIHLYRLLERISFAFPVIYASSTHDYKKAYDALKSYVSDKNAGELKFFHVFQETVIDAAILDGITMTFDMSAMPNDSSGKAAAAISRLANPTSITNSAGGVTEIKCGGIFQLFVNLRNRFFHFGSDHAQNISMSELSDVDQFFSRVNSNFINWIGFLYAQTLVKKCT